MNKTKSSPVTSTEEQATGQVPVSRGSNNCFMPKVTEPAASSSSNMSETVGNIFGALVAKMVFKGLSTGFDVIKHKYFTKDAIERAHEATNDKIKLDTAQTENKGKLDGIRTDNRIKFDDAHTDNIIKVERAKSEIRINEAKQRKAIFTQPQPQAESAVKPTSLGAWIKEFNAEHPMPDLSSIPVLEELVDGCPESYGLPMLIVMLVAFGGLCFSKVRARYLDGKLHAPNLLAVVEGESGSGKGAFYTMYKTVFQRLINTEKPKLANDSPNQIIQTAGINISISMFMKILRDNNGAHMFVFETEIAKVSEAFNKANGLSVNYLRNAFDNDEVYQANMNKDGAAQGSFPVFMNCVFTGTPKAVAKFFNKKELEGGTARRFAFCCIPELGRDVPEIPMPDAKFLEEIQDKIDEWHGKFCYTHDQQSNQDTVCPEYEIDLQFISKSLRDWMDKQYDRYVEQHIVEYNTMRTSIASLAFNAAIVLYMLADEPDSNRRKCRNAVNDLTILIADYCMERFVSKFATTTDDVQEVDEAVPKKRILSEAELEFAIFVRTQVDDNGQRIGYGTIAKRYGISKDDLRNQMNRYLKTHDKQ